MSAAMRVTAFFFAPCDRVTVVVDACVFEFFGFITSFRFTFRVVAER
jgi:hypothetical protein